MHEILEVIKESGFNKQVELTSDSCYSGQLCYAAKKWWEDNIRNHAFTGPDKSQIGILRINATTYKHSRGVWAKYRKCKNKVMNMGDSNDKIDEENKKYSDKFGLSFFTSNVNEGEPPV